MPGTHIAFAEWQATSVHRSPYLNVVIARRGGARYSHRIRSVLSKSPAKYYPLIGGTHIASIPNS